VYMSQVPPALRADPPELLAAIVESSRDERPLMRSTAAFALGAHAGPEATRRLVAMLNDSYPDVRYNAATMLAMQGDDRAAVTLVEMLDPTEMVAVKTEEQPASRDFKRQLILVNALRATKELAAKNPSADLSALGAAVEKLTRTDSPTRIRTEANAVLIEIKHQE